MDLAAANDSNLSVHLQTDGAFAGAPIFLDGGLDDARALEVVDVSGERLRDLVAVGAGSEDVRIYEQLSAGVFDTTPTTFDPGGSFRPVDLAAGDLDEDGDIDLAVVDAGDASILLFTNVNRITFFEGQRIRVPAFSPLKVVVGDADQDGDLDLLATDQDEVRVFLQAAPGQFRDVGPTYPGSFASQVDLRDIDGDGSPDLAHLESTVLRIRFGGR